MAAGIRVRNALGVEVIGPGTWLGRTLGQVTLGDAHGPGSVNVPGFTSGTPFATAMIASYFSASAQGTLVTDISISGTTLSWSAGDACTIVYGVY